LCDLRPRRSTAALGKRERWTHHHDEKAGAET
jgi:hypothetical protein